MCTWKGRLYKKSHCVAALSEFDFVSDAHQGMSATRHEIPNSDTLTSYSEPEQMAMPQSITSLPLDLLNVIADDLDTNSLRALALASPAFLAATRRILFQTLSVDGRRPSRIQAFEDFLHNAPQQVRAAVRTLKFIDTAASSSSSRSQPIPTHLINSVLECLPFLTHLILRSANIRNALPLREIGADAHSSGVAPPQRDLECLEFRAMTLKSGTLDDYRAILSVFRTLGTLRIVSCEWPGESGAESDALQCTSALAVSRFEVRGQWDVLEWLTLLSGTRTLGNPETGEEPTLREIDVMCRSVGDTETLGTFLRAAGSNVRDFACHLDGPFDGRDEPSEHLYRPSLCLAHPLLRPQQAIVSSPRR